MARLIMKPQRAECYKTFDTIKVGQSLRVRISHFKNIGALRSAACIYSKRLNGSVISVNEDGEMAVISHNIKQANN